MQYQSNTVITNPVSQCTINACVIGDTACGSGAEYAPPDVYIAISAGGLSFSFFMTPDNARRVALEIASAAAFADDPAAQPDTPRVAA